VTSFEALSDFGASFVGGGTYEGAIDFMLEALREFDGGKDIPDDTTARSVSLMPEDLSVRCWLYSDRWEGTGQVSLGWNHATKQVFVTEHRDRET